MKFYDFLELMLHVKINEKIFARIINDNARYFAKFVLICSRDTYFEI